MPLISRIVYILLFVVSTLWVMLYRPDIHKPVIFENQEFKLETSAQQADNGTRPTGTLQVSDGTSTANTRPEPVIYNISPESVSSSSDNWIFQQDQPKTKTKTINVSQPKTATNTANVVVNQPKNIDKTVNIIKNEPETVNKTVNVKTPKQEKTFSQIVEESQKNPDRDLSLEEIKTVINALTGNSQNDYTPPNSQTVQKPFSTEQKQLTESEEIIAWNIWRANFQNTVMKNSGNIPAPIGTAFLYSCIVDKYGNISNINVWSTNPNYTPMAKQYVKPAITGMRHKPVLNFPKGTKRTSVVAEGSFIMSNVDRYASPSYYSDYERVRVQK